MMTIRKITVKIKTANNYDVNDNDDYHDNEIVILMTDNTHMNYNRNENKVIIKKCLYYCYCKR